MYILDFNIVKGRFLLTLKAMVQDLGKCCNRQQFHFWNWQKKGLNYVFLQLLGRAPTHLPNSGEVLKPSQIPPECWETFWNCLHEQFSPKMTSFSSQKVSIQPGSISILTVNSFELNLLCFLNKFWWIVIAFDK